MLDAELFKFGERIVIGGYGLVRWFEGQARHGWVLHEQSRRGNSLFCHHRRHKLRPDQDRLTQPLGSADEIQSTPPHRTVAWQERGLRRHERAAERAVTTG